MNQKLKLGVVGAGNIFKNVHAKAWVDHPEVEIAAICDVNEQRANAVAKELGAAYVYTDYQDLLKHEEIDIIDVCTPNLYHSAVSIAALLAGKHVFCEKPDAVNPEEAQKMADAAKASGKLLMTMRNNRFTPASQYLKKFIDEGHMGEIYTGRCGWIRRRGIPGKGGWFTNKELSGGGPLIDLGVHFIDLAMWLMGNPKPASVKGAIYTKFADANLSDSEHSQFGEKQENGTFNVEDLATGFILFENGASLQIEFSWASNIGQEMNFVEFRGTKAGSKIVRGELEIYTEIAGELTNLTPVLKKGNQPHGEHIRHFVDCVLERSAPINLPEHGVDMIQILSAIYQSAETGREVILQGVSERLTN